MQSPLQGTCRITQEFGNDFILNGKWVYRSMGYPGHFGIDFAGPFPGRKLPLVFPADCFIVEKNISRTGYGNHIKVHTRINDKKYQWVFAHLDSFGNFQPGDVVKEGSPLGVMGTTGTSTAVHLHWDCRVLNEDNTVVNGNSAYKGFYDFLSLSRGSYTSDQIKNALVASFGDNIPVEPTYIEKWNNWLVENDIVSKGDFSEEQIRTIIAMYRITFTDKNLTPIPL